MVHHGEWRGSPESDFLRKPPCTTEKLSQLATSNLVKKIDVYASGVFGGALVRMIAALGSRTGVENVKRRRKVFNV